MIKLLQVLPLLRRMAGFAPQGIAGCIVYRHPLLELPTVNIFVTRRAVELLEMVKRHLSTGQRLMTFKTSYCGVTSCERKTGGLMLCQSKTGSPERSPIVTFFASIIPGRTGELPFVLVPVAINTKGIFDFESRLLCGRNVTLGALHHGMRKDQRKARLRVICDREG
jgi:hypothetical protein